ncbi:MAG: Asp-tRNA(Asn)/Glu-tRNA(Gln) amidotransferase subunit GatC [Deltaproteobacteria bacterium]|nr:Asp-tRNA(Asn)/Glu-tRNA(Gln) amidotransferase subunit GatC [Deltaproteobacteria bacterium]
MISESDLVKLARLARLTLSGAETTKLTGDLNSILGYVKVLESVDVSKIEPMSHVHGSTNVFRNDVVEPSLPVEQVLAGAPDSSGRFIRVPIVIDPGAEH